LLCPTHCGFRPLLCTARADGAALKDAHLFWRGQIVRLVLRLELQLLVLVPPGESLWMVLAERLWPGRGGVYWKRLESENKVRD
jgi:hypothetical protein